MTRIRAHLEKFAPVAAIAMAAAAMVAALPVEALASGDSADWRPTFDLVMRWVNFLILFFVIVKYSRAPIRSFLEGRKEEIASRIGALEEQKQKIVSEIEQGQEMLENSRERLSRLKKKIIADGEKNRQRIIKEAQRESRLMIAGAGQKMKSRIQEARDELKADLVDLAASIAMDRLPAQMTEQDNQRFVDDFLKETTEK